MTNIDPNAPEHLAGGSKTRGVLTLVIGGVCGQPGCDAAASQALVSDIRLCENHWGMAVRDFNLAVETLRAADVARECAAREIVPAGAERLRWMCPGCGQRDTLWVDSGTETTYCLECPYERDEYEHRRRSTQAFLFRAHGRSVVYYIRFGAYVKIGFTANLGRRLAALPHDEVVAIEFGARALELKRHGQFRAAHHSGEWFKMSLGLVEHVESLGVPAAQNLAA